MNWRFISSKFFLSVLFIACIGMQPITSVHSTDWHALENPAFMDLPLTQTELNMQSAEWVESLESELRRSWNPNIRKKSADAWLVSQKKEVERELANAEDGTIYSLYFNLSLGKRILHELRKHKSSDPPGVSPE